MSAGMLFVGAFCTRLACYSPENNWGRKDADDIVNYYTFKRHVFFDPVQKDFEAYAKLRPDYKN